MRLPPIVGSAVVAIALVLAAAVLYFAFQVGGDLPDNGPIFDVALATARFDRLHFVAAKYWQFLPIDMLFQPFSAFALTYRLVRGVEDRGPVSGWLLTALVVCAIGGPLADVAENLLVSRTLAGMADAANITTVLATATVIKMIGYIAAFAGALWLNFRPRARAA